MNHITYRWNWSTILFLLFGRVFSLHLCRSSKPVDNTHWVQQTPKAECLFLGKASLAFIQFSKRLMTLRCDKGIGISGQKTTVPHQVYTSLVDKPSGANVVPSQGLPHNPGSSDNLSWGHSQPAWVTDLQCYRPETVGFVKAWPDSPVSPLHFISVPALPGNQPSVTDSNSLGPGWRIKCPERKLCDQWQMSYWIPVRSLIICGHFST